MSKKDKVKGKTKEALGNLTGNDRLKREGKADQAKGTVKGAVNKVANKVTGRE
jgi:uncharacterized protein YjbJ (UPF0337 family)